MKITIYPDDRAMTLKALELADAECDKVRDALERLQIDDMAVQAFQGVLGSVRVALKDANQVEHDLDLTHRRAIGIALLFYRSTINKRREGDEKLLIDPQEIINKLSDVTAMLERLAGQETLFEKSTEWASGGKKKSATNGDGNGELPFAPAGGTTRELDDAHI